MTTGASISTKERPSLPAKEWGGPLRFQNVIRLSSHTNKGHPKAAPVTIIARTSLHHHAILTQGVVQHPLRSYLTCKTQVSTALEVIFLLISGLGVRFPRGAQTGL